ncbi:DUF4230 domain-containing protein [Chryseomicrobium palamuruense]|uniref:DUF4230 domain-containing protein n=1 Tax=Chryseomicrobium palamuruense TaxID=682973 RepID=A0ABV8UUC2_9BACL
MSRKKQVEELEKLLQELKQEETAATYAEASPPRSFNWSWKVLKFIPNAFWITLAIVLILAIVTPIYFWNFLGGSTFTEEKSAIVERLNNLEELATAESVTKVIIEREDNELFGQEIGVNLPGTLRKVLVVVPGQVRAGIDFAGITENDIELDEETKTATLTIPKPQILGDPTIIFDQVEIHSFEGLLRGQPDISEAYELAEEAQALMIKESEQQGLLTLAEANAGKTLNEMFQLVGYDVTIEFKE